MPQSTIARNCAPSSAPAFAGFLYVDTSAGKVYVAMGTSAAADWRELVLA